LGQALNSELSSVAAKYAFSLTPYIFTLLSINNPNIFLKIIKNYLF
jgi:hypothetical protein